VPAHLFQKKNAEMEKDDDTAATATAAVNHFAAIDEIKISHNNKHNNKKNLFDENRRVSIQYIASPVPSLQCVDKSPVYPNLLWTAPCKDGQSVIGGVRPASSDRRAAPLPPPAGRSSNRHPAAVDVPSSSAPAPLLVLLLLLRDDHDDVMSVSLQRSFHNRIVRQRDPIAFDVGVTTPFDQFLDGSASQVQLAPHHRCTFKKKTSAWTRVCGNFVGFMSFCFPASLSGGLVLLKQG
jgi:hypothetical protein